MAQSYQTLVRDIKTFDGHLTPGSLSIFYAKRHSGKSYLMKDLAIRNKAKFDAIIAISGTAFTGYWNKLADVVHDKYSAILLDRIIKKQSGPTPFKNVLLILDDVISDADLRHDKTLEQLATKGRHYNITVMLATQNATSLAPIIRRNADYVFLFKQFNLPMIQTLSEEYCVWPLQKNDFIQLIQGRLTDDYQAVVVNTRVQSTRDLTAIYMTFKAKDHQTSSLTTRPASTAKHA